MKPGPVVGWLVGWVRMLFYAPVNIVSLNYINTLSSAMLEEISVLGKTNNILKADNFP